MNKIKLYTLLVVTCLVFSSFGFHKFYVSIYQINYAPEKKMLQITSRLFVDDVNAVLLKKYGKRTNLGEKNETQEDVNLMIKYILDNFSLKVNDQLKPVNFLSKEMEGNVIICYYNVKDIPKIRSLEVRNSALIELNSEQQNIIQSTIYGEKQSLLLTSETLSGILK
ncbi:MAG: hypothetical protein EBR38_07205 [Flavobacteriaceae bacterium]|jgi:hypothetical protein|nr:hypothetical protein [Flavobacteriaceae bacterium]